MRLGRGGRGGSPAMAQCCAVIEVGWRATVVHGGGLSRLRRWGLSGSWRFVRCVVMADRQRHDCCGGRLLLLFYLFILCCLVLLTNFWDFGLHSDFGF